METKMAVISKEGQDNKLVLEIDNGDKTKLEEIMKTWGFKDIQSFWRFSLSILLATEDKGLWIQANNQPRKIAPDDSLIKGKNNG